MPKSRNRKNHKKKVAARKYETCFPTKRNDKTNGSVERSLC